MICKNCNEAISLESKFCRHCGKQVKNDPELRSRIVDSESATSPKNFAVILFALVSCFLTAAVVVILERTIEFSVHSFMMWGIIPIGAGITGFVAVSGYYLGVKKLNLKYNRNILVGSLVVSIFAFFLINYISYFFMDIDGKMVRDYVGFAEYMDISLTKTHYQLVSRYQPSGGVDLGESGSWGYVIGLLQLIGFGIGGVVCFLVIRSEIYCDNCRMYFKNKIKANRYFSDSNLAVNFYTDTKILFQQNKIGEALDKYKGEVKPVKHDYLASCIEVKECPKCKDIYIKHWLSRIVKNEWKDLSETKYNFITLAI